MFILNEMIETMGDLPIKERKARSHNSTSDYYVNEDGSVTRKTLVNDEVISKVSSASKTKKHIPTNKKSNLKNVIQVLNLNRNFIKFCL